MKNYKDDEQLKSYSLATFKGGYNSYASGKATVADNEFPYGQNVVLDNNGSIMKRNGKQRYGGVVATGKAIRGMGWLYNNTYNRLIVAAGTAWYYNDGTDITALTGVTFTDDKPTHFCQAMDRLYGANNTDKLAYTSDGEAITEQTSNGNVGDWPIYYNQRLYMTNSTYKDRIYYSNPCDVDLTANPPTLTTSNFGTFDTDLNASPKKNAGFIVLIPGGGVEITRLWNDNTSGTDYIYAYTKRHGIWRISYNSANDDGSIAHNVTQIVTANGCPSGDSVVKVANDQWFYGGDNFYTYGESAQYQNLRINTKSGRIRTEVNSITSKSSVVGGYFRDKLYFAYQIGTYNDRCLVYDIRMNAWGAPLVGIKANCFLEYEDSNGTTRFLAGSSDSSDSYIYELETGTNDNDEAVSAFFETKSTDCKTALLKYFGFIDVFYTTLYGVITYEVWIDESLSLTGQVQVGNSTDKPSGIGSRPIGSFPIGKEYDPATTFASLSQNDYFRIQCDYASGHNISVRITNNNTGEQFKIDGINIYYLVGSVYEQ